MPLLLDRFESLLDPARISSKQLTCLFRLFSGHQGYLHSMPWSVAQLNNSAFLEHGGALLETNHALIRFLGCDALQHLSTRATSLTKKLDAVGGGDGRSRLPNGRWRR